MASITLNCQDFPCPICEFEINGELTSHIKSCLIENSKTERSILNLSQRESFETQYILFYILGLIKKWNNNIEIYKFTNYLVAFQIYEHFYHLKTNSLWRSALIGCDNLTRIILSVIQSPENLYLQVPPDITLQDFEN